VKYSLLHSVTFTECDLDAMNNSNKGKLKCVVGSTNTCKQQVVRKYYSLLSVLSVSVLT